MERQLSQQSLGKAYRQFSRQKYNKYRHQFPSMRQSQVVVKIIRQWQKMSMEDKISLNQKFTLRKCYQEEDQFKTELMTTNKKSELSAQKQRNIQHEMNIYPKKNQYKVVDDESNFNRDSVRIEENKQQKESSSYLVVKARQNDAIKKAQKASKKDNYIKFYKFQYERHIKLHPTWDSVKISQIIKLLWANKIKNDKITKRLYKKKIIFKTRDAKKLTGRQFFREMKMKKGCSMRDINSKWRRLTHQGKVMFGLRGKGQNDYIIKKNFVKDVVNLKSSQNTSEHLNYLFKSIK